MTPDKDILFLPKRLPSEEKWTGRKLGPTIRTFTKSPASQT